MTKHRLEISIFLFALTVFLGVFLLMIYFHGEDFMIRSDSNTYLQPARNLVNWGVFSQSDKFPLVPDARRTPLYPLFLASFFVFTNKLWFIGIFQCFLASLGIVYVFRIGNLIGGKRVGVAGAILFSLDFYHAVTIGWLLSEALFIPLFIISIYYFLLFLKLPRNRNLIISGVFLGLATLVRPVSLYLWIILIALTLIYKLVFKKKLQLSLIRSFIIFGFVFGVVILPWLLRNQMVFGRFALSSITDSNLYFWNLTSLHADNFGIPKNEVYSFLEKEIKQKFPDIKDEDITNFKLTTYYKEQIKQTLKGNKLKYLKEHLSGSIYLLVSNYYRKAAYALIGKTDEDIPIYDIMQLLKKGRFFVFKEIFKLIKNGGFPVLMMIVGFSISGIYLFFLVINIFYLSKVKKPEYEILLYGTIAYFALITGPLGSGRYRQPVLPFIIILALLGFSRILNNFKLGN